MFFDFVFFHTEHRFQHFAVLRGAFIRSRGKHAVEDGRFVIVKVPLGNAGSAGNAPARIRAFRRRSEASGFFRRLLLVKLSRVLKPAKP